MASATLNLRVISPRMLTPRQADDYCGLPTKQLAIAPVEMPNGKKLYDIRDLDEYLDGLKSVQPGDDDTIIGRLGR